MPKLLRVLLALLFGILACLGALGLVFHFRYSLPIKEAVAQSVWIPSQAKVYPRETVQPGTFRTPISFEKLRDTTQPGQPMVVLHAIEAGKPFLEYYRATQDGSGIFDYVSIRIPSPPKNLPWLDSLLTDWDTPRFDEQNRAFQFTLGKSWVLLLGGSLLVFFSLAALTMVFSTTKKT